MELCGEGEVSKGGAMKKGFRGQWEEREGGRRGGQGGRGWWYRRGSREEEAPR